MQIMRRFGPAAASLAVAIVLWFVVHNLDRSPARFTVPVTYEVGSDFVVLEGRVTEVEVQVRATKPKLRTLQATAFVVRVRHSPGRVGREFVVLDASDVEAPFAVVVERVTPSQFSVTYDRRMTRQVPIVLDIQGKPAEGHELVNAETVVRPTHVRLSGAESLFGSRTSVKTERIDIGGRVATLELGNVALVPPGPSFTIDGGSNVAANVVIRPIRLRRTFDDVAIEVAGGASHVSRPNPRAIRVTIEGDQIELAGLRASAVHASIDVSDLAPRDEDYHLEPAITVDAQACPSCSVVGRSQGRVDVSVKPARKPSRSRSRLDLPPSRVPAIGGA